MPQTAQTDPEFEFKVTPEIEEPAAIQALAAPPNPLGPLAHLVGEHESATWAGTGFNTIWRPHTLAGGGTANTAFLEAASSPPGGNAQAAQVDATFWIETVADDKGGPDKLQLQYTQLVQLDFNGLRWPHVTVATLQKQ